MVLENSDITKYEIGDKLALRLAGSYGRSVQKSVTCCYFATITVAIVFVVVGRMEAYSIVLRK